VFEATNSLFLGDSAEVIGRNMEGTWWLVRIGSYAPCWVWDDLVEISGNVDGVGVVESPPTPTSTALPLPVPAQVGPTGSLSCRSTVVLDWNPVSDALGDIHYEWKLVGPLGKTEGSSNESQKEVVVGCGKSYTWQVRVVTALGVQGAYSGKMEFTINP
jgi:hypothetical protein